MAIYVGYRPYNQYWCVDPPVYLDGLYRWNAVGHRRLSPIPSRLHIVGSLQRERRRIRLPLLSALLE